MNIGKIFVTTAVISVFSITAACASNNNNDGFAQLELHPALNSTNTQWHAKSKTLTITESVQFVPDGRNNWTFTQMDKLKDEFYWDIPCDIKTVLIDENVTVTGHLRMTCEQNIEGKSRFNSIIYGTPTKAWARGENKKEDEGTRCSRNGQPAKVAGDDIVHDCEKWQYGAISVVPTAPQNATFYVKNLTVENPRTYAITSIRHTFHIDGVNILNTREYPDTQSNSDGIGGGPGTVIKNTYIDTWDDSIKLYRDGMIVENVTIVHNPNGAPFQFGWGNKPATNHLLKNVKVIESPSKSPQKRYNLPLFANSGGKVDATVRIAGMTAEYKNNSILNKCMTNQPIPLVYLKHPQSKITLINANNSQLRLFAPVIECGAGTLVWPGNQSTSTNMQTVTGCENCKPQ
ncbi:hypothetical protein [Catenovulum adriaticum]|uniref:Glycosyl hydrolase family 28 n=1 Tax=Catenovulum adriaticum TaxID=2984846 RepID=A0ABY7ATA5_9ALTE|nr:hypothetical protein [Catenovulum sp. TS8]WAJ71755.1 hypothetical protein OLW01_15565 [Catenovulum sp. TS8]